MLPALGAIGGAAQGLTAANNAGPSNAETGDTGLHFGGTSFGGASIQNGMSTNTAMILGAAAIGGIVLYALLTRK